MTPHPSEGAAPFLGHHNARSTTHQPIKPQELVPELTAAVEKVGLKWADFIITDNSCKPHPPPKSLVEVRCVCVWGGGAS